MSKTKSHKEDSFENVESVLSRSEQFIENNQKLLTIIAGSIIIIAAGIWSIKELYLKPRNIKAQESMFSAQNYFEKDSFQLALDGDGNTLGFLKIIDKFGSTKAGNLANCYTGLCYLHMGKFNEAIKYLKEFSGDDKLLSFVATGAIGDAYLELGQKDKAISYYKDATKGEDELTTPVYLMKLGLIYEESGKQEDAVEAYKLIKDKYKNSTEARQIDKYITRAEFGLKK